jgi:hypothetical protein
VASGTDRSLFSIFADRELYPYVIEKCEQEPDATPGATPVMRYRVRFADGSKNDAYEFDADELDDLDDETHEKLRSVCGGSLIAPRPPRYDFQAGMKGGS